MKKQYLFEIMKFYEEATYRIKDHIWTITAWLLALNSAIIAFCFKFYTDHPENKYLLLFEIVFYIVGTDICLFTFILIDDH